MPETRVRRWRLAIIAVCCLVLIAGCTSVPQPEFLLPAQRSTWGDIITLGAAQQLFAPAMLPLQDRVEIAWTGGGVEEGSPSGEVSTGFFQWMRGAALQSSAPDVISEIVRLPLPPVFPQAQQLFPAGDDHTHLLWLDAAYDDDANRAPLLWSALFTPSRDMAFGPVRLTPPGVFRYAALGDGAGGVQIVYSTGIPAEPQLMLLRLDASGRPRPTLPLGSGDWPVLVQAGDGHTRLFWLDALGRVQQATLSGDTLTGAITTGAAPQLARGDRLRAFTIGVDVTHVYAFWTIARASGEVETWLASGHIEDPHWSMPRRLGITVETTQSLETGFNGGAAQVAVAGERWLRWANPLPGVFDVLAVAAQVDDRLGIVYLQNGDVVGYQPVVDLGESQLITPPVIRTDIRRHLYLTWVQSAGYINLTTTH
ncbi:MAG: hypothetical protein OHK0046_44320 [Anaerolineae bacterium]